MVSQHGGSSCVHHHWIYLSRADTLQSMYGMGWDRFGESVSGLPARHSCHCYSGFGVRYGKWLEGYDKEVGRRVGIEIWQACVSQLLCGAVDGDGANDVQGVALRGRIFGGQSARHTQS